ncbi:hypothetical protein JJ685_23490 [Ramlibacter monticola]|uniref:O-antigen ligase domain-containing protein n=1 Tax=Ramlibacter monticola TaxID=1926872 RepID=A0A936Z3G7_9BURK|nr:hypothetical protein [Ramlibacter monticola]MBL0394123.1 hypothetical protein [Ramlibacter monticola]
MRTLEYKSSVFATIAVAAALCALHLGINEYLSTQFAGFALLSMLAVNLKFERLVRLYAPGVAVLVLLGAGYILADHELNTVLRSLRMGVVMLVLFAAQLAMPPSAAKRLGGHAFSGLFLAILASCVLAAGQLVDSLYLNRGLFDIPQRFFAIDYGTVFSEQREWLSQAGYLIRPSASFSEPSALVALGLVGIVASYSYSNRILRWLSFLAIALSMSLSGLLFGVFITITEQRRQARMGALLPSLGVFAIAVAILLYSPLLSTRIISVVSGEDASAAVRIFEPVRLISELLRRNWFFGASEGALRALSPNGAGVFDNWMLNQLMFYGVLGVGFIWLAFVVVPRRLWHLVIAFAFLNGELFYYDRLLLLWISCLVIAGGNDNSKGHNRKRHLQQYFGVAKNREFCADPNIWRV